MKKNENTVSVEYFCEVLGGMRFALGSASRQLELCGWCPKAENNDLNGYYYTCELARREGVRGCHDCIAEHFITEIDA